MIKSKIIDSGKEFRYTKTEKKLERSLTLLHHYNWSFKHFKDKIFRDDIESYTKEEREILLRTTLSSSDGEKGSSWDFGLGWEGAIKLGKEGWREKREAFKSRIDSLTRLAKPKRDDLVFRSMVSGSSIQMGKAIAGEPNCFTNAVFGEGQRVSSDRVVKIILNIGASAGVNAECYERRGDFTYMMAKMLELAGKSTEIVIVMPVRNYWDNQTYGLLETTIKKAEQAFDDDKLSFYLTHPAVMRRLFFRFLELSEANEDLGCRGGYGSPSSLQRIEEEFEMELIKKGDFYVGDLHLDRVRSWKGEQDLIRQMQEDLETFGINLELN